MAGERGRIELSSINPELGEATEEVEAEYDGDAITVGFNARYLLDVLGILASEGRVELGLNDDSSPGVVREVGDPDFSYIVMPMRL